MNKKGFGLWSITGIGFFLACITAVFFLAEKPHIETFMGEIPLHLVVAKQKADQKMIFIEQSSKLAARNAIIQLYEQGGYYEENYAGVKITNLCGNQPYLLWNHLDADCFPDYEESFARYYEDNFNRMLDQDSYTSPNNYDFTYTTSPITINALAKRPLVIDIKKEVRDHFSVVDYSGALIWPTTHKNPPISSCYGFRPGIGDGFHDGIDVAGDNFDIVAPARGTVVQIHRCTGACNSGAGNYIIIRHNENLHTRFSHLSRILVSRVGQVVEQNEVIAKSGNTGSSTGAHLDYKIYTSSQFGKDEAVSPLCFYSQEMLDNLKATATAQTCHNKYRENGGNFKLDNSNLQRECSKIQNVNPTKIREQENEETENKEVNLDVIPWEYLVSDADFTDQTVTREKILDYLKSVNSPLLDQIDGKYPLDTIMEESADHNINPIVILATIQKESSLVQKPNSNPGLWNYALGCGCPDKKTKGYESCDPKKKGFHKQVACAADTLENNFKGAPKFDGTPVILSGINYDGKCPDNSNTDRDKVGVKNKATYSLFRYTPHTYDICIGSGSEGGGNAAFYNIFSNYLYKITGKYPGTFFSDSFSYGTYEINPSFITKTDTNLDLIGASTQFAAELMVDCDDELEFCFNQKIREYNKDGGVQFYHSCDEHQFFTNFIESTQDCIDNEQEDCVCNIQLDRVNSQPEEYGNPENQKYEMEFDEFFAKLERPRQDYNLHGFSSRLNYFSKTPGAGEETGKVKVEVNFEDYKVTNYEYVDVYERNNWDDGDQKVESNIMTIYKPDPYAITFIADPEDKYECANLKRVYRFCAASPDLISVVENKKLVKRPFVIKAAVYLDDIQPPNPVENLDVTYPLDFTKAIISWQANTEKDVHHYNFYEKEFSISVNTIKFDDDHLELLDPPEEYKGYSLMDKEKLYFDDSTNKYYYAVSRKPSPWFTNIAVSAEDVFGNIYNFGPFQDLKVEGYDPTLNPLN